MKSDFTCVQECFAKLYVFKKHLFKKQEHNDNYNKVERLHVFTNHDREKLIFSKGKKFQNRN